MTVLTALWLPILLSAALVFVASAILNMVTPWHKHDFPKLPREDEFRAAVGALGIPPGDYMIPRASSAEEMKSAGYAAKMEQGPNIIMTVVPNGVMGIGKSLALWFLYCVAVSIAAGWVAATALPPASDYMSVFRIVTVTAFLGYAMALFQTSIWYRRAWSLTIKSMIDGLVYATVTAGAFGWLWPA